MENAKVNFQWIQNTDEKCAQVLCLRTLQRGGVTLVWFESQPQWALTAQGRIWCKIQVSTAENAFAPKCTGENTNLSDWVRETKDFSTFCCLVQKNTNLKKTPRDSKKSQSGKRNVHLKIQMLLLCIGAGKNACLNLNSCFLHCLNACVLAFIHLHDLLYFSVKTPLYQSYLTPVFIFPLSYVVSTKDRQVHLQQQQDLPCLATEVELAG